LVLLGHQWAYELADVVGSIVVGSIVGSIVDGENIHLFVSVHRFVSESQFVTVLRKLSESRTVLPSG